MIVSPEEKSSERSTRAMMALAILALILGAGIVYLAASTTLQANTESTTISSLQSSVSRLLNENQALQAELVQTSTSATGNGSSTAANNAEQINAEQIYAADNASVVTIQGAELVNSTSLFGTVSSVETLLGSGFVVSYSGSYYIVTNYHVVNGVTNMTVTFSNGDAYPGKVVGTDAYSDLAVVSAVGAASSEYIPLQLISSAGVVVGQPVVVIGNPFGLSGTMTYGIVSQLGRTIQEATTNGFSISDIIQFSAPINPGNSGGPLLDQAGNVIGITTATVNGSQGLGFAIPSSTILEELPSLITTGTYTDHSYLGISTADMNYQLARLSKTNVTYGVIVESVVSGGPAAKAGIKAGSTSVVVDGETYLIGGDIIVSVNGTKIVNGDALASYLEEYTVAGQTIQLGIIRSGQLMTVNVVLGARPPP